MDGFVVFRVDCVALLCAGELFAEAWDDVVDGAFGGFDEVGHECARVFGADGDADGGWADAGVGEGLFAHFAVACDGGAENDGVGLAERNLVAEDGVEAIEEAGEGDAVDVGAGAASGHRRGRLCHH